MTCVGLVLAAGRGTRMGWPKVLTIDAERGAWVHLAIEALRTGGCDRVVVVLGAAADEASELIAGTASTVVSHRWSAGPGASLRAGLEEIGSDAEVVIVHVVDTPEVGADVVARVTAAATPTGLVRSVSHGIPGHPVAIGHAHVAPLLEVLGDEHGARDYLNQHDVMLVDCSDLGSAGDIDHSLPSLSRWEPGAVNDA